MDLESRGKQIAKAIAEELIADADITIMGHTDSEWGKGYDEGHRTAYLGAAYQIAIRFGLNELADQAFGQLKIKSK